MTKSCTRVMHGLHLREHVCTRVMHAFENKNKPVSVRIIVTTCTIFFFFFFGYALSKLQLESIIQLTIARSDIDQRKEIGCDIDGKVSDDIEAKKWLSKRKDSER